MQCYPMVGYIVLHGTCHTFPNKEAAFETVRNILFNGGTFVFFLLRWDGGGVRIIMSLAGKSGAKHEKVKKQLVIYPH